MLTQIEHREVETSGVLQSNAFTIKANGKAFKVLIDGLYSDKIRSIVRELWSNAFDSHVAAGKVTVPFDCQLPTTWDPYFRVRDYGTSLSHDAVMHLYTTVFESSKEDTNDQVGKLGLGSKSPFAYSDTFTVTTWLNGEKRIYSAFIGSDYVPMIALLGVEETEEPQGLEVAFPVKTNDATAFHLAADRVVKAFDVPPNTFDVSLTADNPVLLYEGPGWKLFDDDETAMARQGCVIYPIDPNMVSGASDTQKAFLNSALFMDFKIGELEIAASREGLGYTSETCRNILAAVDRAATVIEAVLMAEYAEIANYWDACAFFVRKEGQALPPPVRAVLKNLRFKSRPLKEKWRIDDPQVKNIASSIARGSRRRRNEVGWEGRANFNFHPIGSVVYFQDATKHVTRIRERLKHHYASQNINRADKDIVLVRGVPGSIALKRAWIALGRPPHWFDVADLPVPPKESSRRQRVSLKLFHPQKYANHWLDAGVDPTAGGIYVPLHRNEPQRLVNGDYVTMADGEVRTVLDALIALGLVTDDVQLYGIPKSCENVPEKNRHWRCLWDIATEALIVGFKPYKVRRHQILQKAFNNFDQANIGALCRHWHKHNVGVTPGTAVDDLMTAYRAVVDECTALKEQAYYSDIACILHEDNDQLAVVDREPDLEPLAATFVQCYPMVRYALGSSVDHDLSKAVLTYVSILDKRVSDAHDQVNQEAA